MIILDILLKSACIAVVLVGLVGVVWIAHEAFADINFKDIKWWK